MAVEVDDMDNIDVRVREMKWVPKKVLSGPRNSEILPLTEICLNYLVQNFDSIADLGTVSNTLRERMACRLASERRLNHDIAVVVSTTGFWIIEHS